MFWGSGYTEEEERQRNEAANAFSNPSKLPPRLASKSPGVGPTRSYDNGNVSPSRQPRMKTPQDKEVFGDIAASTGIYVKGGAPGGGTAQDPVRVADDNVSPSNMRSTNPQLASYNKSNVDSALSLADAALASANNMIRHRHDDASQLSDSVYTDPVTRSEAQTSVMSSTVDQSVATSNQTSTVDSSNMSQTTTSQPTYASSEVTESHAESASMPSTMIQNRGPHVLNTKTSKVSFPEPTPRTRNLDMRNNDNSFHVIANLVVGLFESKLNSGEKTLVLTQEERTQLDKMVPEHVRNAFADAVRYRFATCPVGSQKQLHTVVRQCVLLGLDREGEKNLLFAKPATVIPINQPHKQTRPPAATSGPTPPQVDLLGDNSGPNFADDNPENLARQQLMAELREASNLMAESVTPEAAKFWRNHVVELQARLRALHGEGGGVHVASSGSGGGGAGSNSMESAEEVIRRNQRYLSSLEHHHVAAPQPSYHSPKQYQAPSPHVSQQQQLSSPQMSSPSAKKFSNAIDPSLQGVPMVDVVAPADLPGGYMFEAEIEEHRFLATVPAGGVKKGETFCCYMKDLDKVASDIPVGRWRDSPTDCLQHGLCHPVIWNTLFCPLISVGQVMERMGFDFTGRPAADFTSERVSPYNVMVKVVWFWSFLNLAIFGAFNYKWSRGMELTLADWISLAVVNVAMILFTICVTASARGSIREKYLIRESRFYDVEDCFCATFCMPCTICQMSRHTASFNDYDGVCCSKTGLPDGVEVDKYKYRPGNVQASDYVV